MQRRDSMLMRCWITTVVCVLALSAWLLLSTHRIRTDIHRTAGTVTALDRLDPAYFCHTPTSTLPDAWGSTFERSADQLRDRLTAARTQVLRMRSSDAVPRSAVDHMLRQGGELESSLRAGAGRLAALDTVRDAETVFEGVNRELRQFAAARDDMVAAVNQRMRDLEHALSARWGIVFGIVFVTLLMTLLSGVMLRQRQRATDQLHSAKSARDRNRHALELFVENIEEAIWMSTPEGTPLFVSPSYEHFTGRAPETLYRDPTSWKTTLTPESRTAVDALSNADGELRDLVVTFQHRDAVDVIARLRRQPIRDVGGEVVAWYTLLSDITLERTLQQERSLATRSLAAKNQQLATLLQAASGISGASTVAQILSVIVDAIMAVGYDHIAVACYEDFELREVRFGGTDEAVQRRILENASTPEQRRVRFSDAFERYRDGHSYYVPADDIADAHRRAPIVHPRLGPDMHREPLTHGVAFIPMIDSQEQIRGVIWLELQLDASPYDASALRYLEFFANLAARAIERRQLRARVMTTVDALRHSERVFQILAENSPGAIYIRTPDGRAPFEFMSHAIESITGVPAASYMNGAATLVAQTHEYDVIRVASEIDAAIERRDTFRLIYRLRHVDGDVRWIEENGVTVFNDETNELMFLVGFMFDVTDRQRVEADLERTRFAVDHALEGMFMIDERGDVIDVNASVCRRLCVQREDVIGQPAQRFIAFFDGGLDMLLSEAFDEHGSVVVESEAVRSDGSRYPVEVSLVRFSFRGRELHCAFLRDITMQKDYEATLRLRNEQEQLLRRELNHRVRNNLSSLIGLVQITADTAQSTRDFARSIRGRIQAVAAVHDLLEQASWNAMSVHRILEKLLPEARQGRLHVDTDTDVSVPMQAATSFALVIHELMTNSTKYGALGVADGVVDVEWSVTPNELHHHFEFRWRERHGPPVDTAPTPGTGTRLISGLIRHLGGTIDIDYHPKGVQVRLRLDLSPPVATAQAGTIVTTVPTARDVTSRESANPHSPP